MSLELQFWWRCGCNRAAAADFIDAALDGETVELLDRQSDKKLDAIFQRQMRLAESPPLLGLRTYDRGGIRHAPMSGHRGAGPDRADFAGGLVANRKDEIHHRHARARAFIPAFAAK